MNPQTHDLARAISDLVPAPAPEYCLFWHKAWWACMTKAEWSGWMQAVGAFVAVMIAIAVPAFQSWLGARRQAAIYKAQATVAAAGVLIAIREIRTWSMRMKHPGELDKPECEQRLVSLARVPRPTEREMTALAAWNPACAIRLSRALGHLNQCEIALKELLDLDDLRGKEGWAPLSSLSNAASMTYDQAEATRLKLVVLIAEAEASDGDTKGFWSFKRWVARRKWLANLREMARS